MELALLQLLTCNISSNGTYLHRAGSLKAVYLAPSKALVQAIFLSISLSHVSKGLHQKMRVKLLLFKSYATICLPSFVQN